MVPYYLRAVLDLQCPQCKSASVRLTAPPASDVMSFKCNDCGRSWSEPLFRNRAPDTPGGDRPRGPREKKRS